MSRSTEICCVQGVQSHSAAVSLVFQVKYTLAQLSKLVLLHPWPGMQVQRTTDGDLDKETAQLNARTKRRPEMEYAISGSEPSQYSRLVCYFLPAIRYAHAQKRGMWLSSKTVYCLVNWGIHSVPMDTGNLNFCYCFFVTDREFAGNGTKSSYWM
mmetsp:Transcript_20886/g.52145  ORF Transcript_20886/g.52145 Transcript_20886/m.52145 type:complete len:155 (+) Transcript_20886:247-711(+)